MDLEARTRLIERYREGPDVVASALEGIGDSELDRKPGPGEWSPREIVHHLADSEMTSAIRLRRLIAEDNPVIYGYDEEKFAERLRYDRPIEASLDALAAARRSTAEILERLSDEEWGRTGWHTEDGAYSALTWLQIYAKHAHDHADQIHRARFPGKGAAGPTWLGWLAGGSSGPLKGQVHPSTYRDPRSQQS